MRKKWLLGLMIGLLAAGLVTTWYVSADFGWTPQQLSQSSAACAAVFPRVDVSPDAQWLGAIWVQGYKYAVEGAVIPADCQGAGSVQLRWSTDTSALDGWSNIINVFNYAPIPGQEGTASCIPYADIAVTDPGASTNAIAHIVATVRTPCLVENSAATQSTTIYYRTYELASGATPSTPEAVVTTDLDVDAELIRNVRVDLDSDNNPHVVYGVADFNGDGGEVYYTRRAGDGTWLTPERVSEPGAASYSPEIAWSNDRAHVVWEVQEPTNPEEWVFNGHVRYTYCTETADPHCVNESYPKYLAMNMQTLPKPSIVAQNDRVIITWNACQTAFDANPPCNIFTVLYARSDDNGTKWDPVSPSAVPVREVGSDDSWPNGVFLPRYDGTDFEEEGAEYKTFLRPVVALNGENMPVVAWQHQDDADGGLGYTTITTTVALSETEASFTWGSVITITAGGNDAGYNAVVPVIGLPAFAGGENGLHLLYMQELEVGKHQAVYDYFGHNRIEPTPPPDICGEDGCRVYLPVTVRQTL